LWAGKTQFSDVVIAKSPIYGRMLFIDGELQSAESDERIYHEHLVHPIMNACTNMPEKRVLIVGGGEGATAREVLKWSAKHVKEIVWVDIDKELVDLSRKYLCYAENVYEDPRVTFVPQDIRVYLQENKDLFDVIILDLPDPDVDYLKEFGEDSELYSVSFWNSLKTNLKPTGHIVSHTGPVSPGEDKHKWRAGLAWIDDVTKNMQSTAYHVNIPSFQSEWGFWMTLAPSHAQRFPEGTVVMDGFAQIQAFSWPAYWFK
jgi:spermidine synthase